MVDRAISRSSGVDAEKNRPNVSRRTILKTTSVGIVGIPLAGCSSSGDGGGTIKIGGMTALSGPYGGLGKNIKSCMELAVQDANKNDEVGGMTAEIEVKDTQTDPSTGQKRAQEYMEQGDIDFLAGSISNSTALAVQEIAERNEMAYVNLGGGLTTTGEECSKYGFVCAGSPVQQSDAGVGYVLEEGLGTSVYAVSYDYSWGQSHKQYQEEKLVPDNGGEFVGNQFIPLSMEDFSQPLTKAQNTGADIIASNTAGGGAVQFLKQAAEFDLLEDQIIAFPNLGLVEGTQIGESILQSENIYAGSTWYYTTEVEEGKKFADRFQEQNDTPPYGLGASMYCGVRTALNAIGEIGTAEGIELANALEDREFVPQIWGSGERFRACDHAATIAQMTVTGRKDQWEENDPWQIANTPENPEEKMRTCAETDCEL